MTDSSTVDPGEMAATSYDVLPYESHPFEWTHPDHLASLARLFGMNSPAVDGCRVLELGCAAGGNLIPLALTVPESTFVGVELARTQLEQGWRQIEALGLQNIQLQHRDILDVKPDEGPFDYIICHGVFSWVSQPVQDKILEICAQNLAPQGVVYLSYNTYPGWFLRGMVRQMMCFHARQFDEPQKQVAQARALLDFLIKAGPAGDETYHALLCRELEILKSRHDSYLYHEHLEEENDPLFFYQLIERAEAHGLRYLAEAQFSEMIPQNFSETAGATLSELGVGITHAEQYLDFLRNRTFRRTLLCHGDNELDRHVGPARLRGVYVGAELRPTALIDARKPGPAKFESASGRTITVSDPLVKSALLGLGKLWPGMVQFESLANLAHDELQTPLIRDAGRSTEDIENLGSLVLELYSADLIELRLTPPRFATELSERPLASPLAAQQARDSSNVTSLRHKITPLSDLQRRLVLLADGARTQVTLCDLLLQLVKDGELVVGRFADPLDDDAIRELLTTAVVQDLQTLVGAGLMIR